MTPLCQLEIKQSLNNQIYLMSLVSRALCDHLRCIILLLKQNIVVLCVLNVFIKSDVKKKIKSVLSLILDWLVTSPVNLNWAKINSLIQPSRMQTAGS